MDRYILSQFVLSPYSFDHGVDSSYLSFLYLSYCCAVWRATRFKYCYTSLTDALIYTHLRSYEDEVLSGNEISGDYRVLDRV